MRSRIRRTGIALLVTSLVTSLLTTSQAGVIPWLYDAIFGPAYPQYRGYPAGWGAGYGPCAPSPCAPCNPCRVGYVPRSSSCASGACSTTAFFGPCGMACSTEVACSTSPDPGVGKLAPTPQDLPPSPRTFDDSPVPDPVPSSSDKPVAESDPATRDVEHPQPTVSGVAAPEGDAEAGNDAGFGETERTTDPANEEFAPPLIRNEAESLEEPTESSAGDSPEQPLGLELDNRTSWRAPIRLERVSMRAGFRYARIARHVQSIDHDYVIPPTTTTQIASK